MAKRGRPLTSPKTIEKHRLANPPAHIARKVEERKLKGFYPWAVVIEDMDRHHEVVERLRRKVQISRSDVDQLLAGYSEGATEEQFNKTLEILQKRHEKIAADVSRGGRAKAQHHQPKWHCEAIRLAKEIKLSRARIEGKISSSSLSELVLSRWHHPTINAPEHRTLRAYLAKSL